ncbi:TPA: phage scaffolding protein, partial [Clostridioides difficile]|nr:phage scaffolding protein [Clostridioides difficile]
RYVEKTELENANKEIKEYKKQIGDRDKQLNDLQGKVKDNKELSDEIESLKNANKEIRENAEKEIYFKKRSVLVNDSKIINFKNLSSSFKLIKLNEFEEYPDFILKLGDKKNFVESVIKINKSNRKSIKNLILKLSKNLK